MKKAIALATAGVLALTLVGCSSSADTSQDQVSSSQTSSSQSATSTQSASSSDALQLDKTLKINGLTLKYPSSWNQVEGNKSGYAYIYPECGGVIAITTGDPTNTPLGNGTPDSVATSNLDDYFEGIANSGNGYNVGSYERVDKGDSVSAVAPVSLTTDGISYSGKIFVSMLQKEIIGVFAAVPDDADAQYKNTIDAIIDEITTENIASESSASTSSQSTQPQQTQPQQQATPQQSTESTQTISQKNALKKAGQYLDYSHFSHSGLVGQLEFEGFSTEDATWAADNCGADWNAQAAGKAQDYLDYSAFSRQGLIDQLLFEGFTQEQAEFGVNAVGL